MEFAPAPQRDVPLVRTDGKQYQNGLVWSVDEMLRAPCLLREHRDQTARLAEAEYGLGASLYFYVGHACPDFARCEAGASPSPVAFVFDAATFDGVAGTMTHFDTGGFFCGKIQIDGLPDRGARAAYVAQHRLDGLPGWRDKFRAHVQEYFRSTRSYVLGERPSPDPHGRHQQNDDRRAWTWELQLQGDHDCRVGLLRLWLLYSHKELLKRRIKELPDPQERRRWQEALRGGRLRAPPAVPTESTPDAVCRHAEEEIASWV